MEHALGVALEGVEVGGLHDRTLGWADRPELQLQQLEDELGAALLPALLPAFLSTFLSTLLSTFLSTFLSTLLSTLLSAFLSTFLQAFLPAFVDELLGDASHGFVPRLGADRADPRDDRRLLDLVRVVQHVVQHRAHQVRRRLGALDRFEEVTNLLEHLDGGLVAEVAKERERELGERAEEAGLELARARLREVVDDVAKARNEQSTSWL